MKATLTFDGNKTIVFPLLARLIPITHVNKEDEPYLHAVVLFTSATSGTVVCSPNGGYLLGHHQQTWLAIDAASSKCKWEILPTGSKVTLEV